MEKKWYKSTEIWAGVLIIASGVAKYFGMDIPLEAILGILGYSLVKNRLRTSK